jgi:alkyl hydroperoxide reductase subunit AhpC
MKRIGDHVPSCRIPALVEGALQYVELGQFKPRWVLLCFLPRLTQVEASILHQQADFGFMAESEVSLVAVGPETTILHESWTRRISDLRLVMLADPLHRLHRAFGIEPATTSRRCQSFVIDPGGILQFLMVHDLNGCGVSALAEIFKAGLAQPAR